jgi:predicted AAA+ superfamily ATPase
VAHIENIQQMPRLIRVLAEYSGQLANYAEIGRRLELSQPTTKKYTDIFEQLFLIKTIQPWSANSLNRLIRTPKVHFLDSGLLAALRRLSFERVTLDRTRLGPLLETFVLSELLKLATGSPHRFEFFHFRDKEGNEVDIVIEDSVGNVVGIEVKASATVRSADFNGLQKLADATGERFKLGLVLYDHSQVVPFGNKLYATPISALW